MTCTKSWVQVEWRAPGLQRVMLITFSSLLTLEGYLVQGNATRCNWVTTSTVQHAIVSHAVVLQLGPIRTGRLEWW